MADEAATVRLGRVLAGCLGFGDVLLLSGKIGAGKSLLARSLIQALFRASGWSIPEVPSPTYLLVQPYSLPTGDIVHADLYRLGDSSELLEIGLVDAFGSALCLIEWPDRLGTYTPTNAIRLDLAIEGTGRLGTFAADGKGAKARVAAVAKGLSSV